MRRQPVLPVVLLLVVGVLLLAGCGNSPTAASGIASNAPNQLNQRDPFPTMRPMEVARECGWDRKAYTWIDKNANGRPDADEPPLPNVKIIAYFEGSDIPQQPADATGMDGYTSWNEMLYGCPNYRIEVVAQPPQGYRLTTPALIKSNYPQDDPPFLFGFVTVEAPANGGTTGQIGATPLPTSQRPASAPTATDVPRATPLPADPTSTLPQASVYSECGWTRIARAWDDRNANGQWEGDEPSLAGVTIVVSGTNAGRPFTYNEITDSQGSTLLSMTLFGCPPAAADVSAEPPPGYTLTTPRIFTSDIKKEDETIQFGFKKK